MSEYDYETTFTFRKPNHFWEFLNKQMVIKDKDSLNDKSDDTYTKKYHLLLFSTMPTDFNSWIDDDGCLDTSIQAVNNAKITSGVTDVEFTLDTIWLDDGENGFSLIIDEEDDVQIPITSGTNTGTDYIVAYARASTSVKCVNYITLMKGSSIVGHSSCKEVA